MNPLPKTAPKFFVTGDFRRPTLLRDRSDLQWENPNVRSLGHTFRVYQFQNGVTFTLQLVTGMEPERVHFSVVIAYDELPYLNNTVTMQRFITRYNDPTYLPECMSAAEITLNGIVADLYAVLQAVHRTNYPMAYDNIS